METLGLLVVARIPDMNVPVCVVECMSGTSVSKCVSKGEYGTSVMACVSNMACEELVRGPTQTVDGFILEIAPAPQNVASKVRSSFPERPGRARLKKPAHEHPAFRKRPSRGWLKWRLVIEFGTDGSRCRHECEAPHAACHVLCSWNARSGSTGRYARAGLHGKPCRFGVRVMSLARTSRRELQINSARCPAWGIPRE